MQGVLIVLMVVFAAVVYGIAHDLVTAHVCLEYFTVGHDPPYFLPHVPWVMALFYGVFATWWVGVLLGCPLAFAARWGDRPALTVGQVVGPVARLLGGLYVLAMVAGVVGFGLASLGLIELAEPLTFRVPPAHRAAFLFCGFAHAASYVGGAVGGLLLVGRTWRRRKTV